MTDAPDLAYKRCSACGMLKPVGEFRRRTGRRRGRTSRRGSCRDCRKERTKPGEIRRNPASAAAVPAPAHHPAGTAPVPPPPYSEAAKPEHDASRLRPNRNGMIGMRGKTDKGRRWYQETDLETAAVLVRERAAVVVNSHTIRRLYSNKSFRQLILSRDRHRCYYCGEPGDTIDHLLPRAKGGHTTPMNCVCACQLCNQSKADQDVRSFLTRGRQARRPEHVPPFPGK